MAESMHTQKTAGASTRMAGAACESLSSCASGSAKNSITPQQASPSRRKSPAVTQKIRRRWFTRPTASA